MKRVLATLVAVTLTLGLLGSTAEAHTEGKMRSGCIHLVQDYKIAKERMRHAPDEVQYEIERYKSRSILSVYEAFGCGSALDIIEENK